MTLLYQTHTLTDEQMQTAVKLNPETRMWLQNIEAEVVQMKLGLVVEPTKEGVDLFVQGEAFLRGKLELLQQILNPTQSERNAHVSDAAQPTA